MTDVSGPAQGSPVMEENLETSEEEEDDFVDAGGDSTGDDSILRDLEKFEKNSRRSMSMYRNSHHVLRTMRTRTTIIRTTRIQLHQISCRRYQYVSRRNHSPSWRPSKAQRQKAGLRLCRKKWKLSGKMRHGHWFQG